MAFLHILSVLGGLAALGIIVFTIVKRESLLDSGRKARLAQTTLVLLRQQPPSVLAAVSEHLNTTPGSGVLKVARTLTVNQLGIVEGDLPGLYEVMVVADHVEEPMDKLRASVMKNLENGVRYIFLVSDSKAADELGGWYVMFRALALIAVARSKSRKEDAEKLVTIKRLPYDWNDFPYVFYRIRRRSERKTLAFRGEQLTEGIADTYQELDSALAHTIAQMVLTGAPSEIAVDRALALEEFKKMGELVPFPREAVEG